MKVTNLVALSILGLSIVSCGETKKELPKELQEEVALTTKVDSVSYALGVGNSTQAKMRKDGIKKDFNLDLNTIAYLQGFKNILDETAPKFDIEKSKDMLLGYFDAQRKLVADAKKEGKDVLTLNKDVKPSGDATLKSRLDSVSYAMGAGSSKFINSALFNDLKWMGVDVNKKAFFKGYMNGLDSLNLKIGFDESKKVADAYLNEKYKVAVENNKKAGEDFLVANKGKEGVKTTKSGLQYVVLQEGTGAKPTAESTVKVHYHGTLLDGTVFDSSVERKEPATFGVGQVIPGWTEGLQLMKTGAKYKFFIPQELAYGAKPRGQFIKPFSPLVFEVELLEVKK